MISNDRQYELTMQQADRFRAAIRQLETDPVVVRHVDPRLRQAERDGMQSQLEDLEAELREYERTKGAQ